MQNVGVKWLVLLLLSMPHVKNEPFGFACSWPGELEGDKECDISVRWMRWRRGVEQKGSLDMVNSLSQFTTCVSYMITTAAIAAKIS